MKDHFLGRGVFLLPFLLTPFLAQTEVLTLLDKAGIDLDPLVLHHQPNRFYNSPFLEWDKLDQERVRLGKIQSKFSWLPTLKKTGTDSLELSSNKQSQTIFFRLGDLADIELGFNKQQSLFSYIDSKQLSVKLNSAQFSNPIGVNYHLLNQSTKSMGLNFLLKIQNLSQLDYRFGIQWIAKTGSENLTDPTLVAQSEDGYSRFKVSRLEITNTFCDISDEFIVKELKSDGSGQQIKGAVQSKNRSLSFYGEAQTWPGIWGTKVNYAWSVPHITNLEYLLVDSSQAIELGLSSYPKWGRVPGSGYLGGYTYSENAVRTQGIRQPPNSAGSKRFHYGLTQSSSHFIFMQSPEWKIFSESYFSFGNSLRFFEMNSQPPVQAITERKETLSYNRLGVSFIADIYGGFSRTAELVHINTKHTSWESSVHFRHNFCLFKKGERALINGRVEFKTPVDLSWVDFQILDSTISQSIFSTDVENIFSQNYSGRVLSATPTVLSSLELLKASWAQLQIQGELSQLFFLWNDLQMSKQTNPNANSTSLKNEGDEAYPIFGNGFYGKLQLVIGF